jgi:RNA polymerase sigma-B factor
VVTTNAVAGATRTLDPGQQAARADAGRLLATFKALPARHPSRPVLREQAIAAWVPLARHLAHRYHGRGELLDDLMQTAMVGLIKAVDRFDPARGTDFTGFAVPTIVGEIRRHFRDRTWDVRVPRRLQELRIAISDANAELAHSLGRSPTVADIAAHLDLTEETVLEGLEGARAYKSASLSAPLGGQDSGTTLGDSIGEADRGFEQTDLRLTLGTALDALSERERRIVRLRFFGNLTQTQIAERVGISQMHVSRLLAKSLVKLRDQIGDVA